MSWKYMTPFQRRQTVMYLGRGWNGRRGHPVPTSFFVHLPPLEVQAKIQGTVDKALLTRDKCLEQAKLLEEIALTVMLNWKGRDPKTGRFEEEDYVR
jgi:hypothetical protein